MDMGAIADRYALEQALELSNNGKSYDAQLAQKAVDALCAAVRQGRISEERISEAYRNVVAVKNRL